MKGCTVGLLLDPLDYLGHHRCRRKKKTEEQLRVPSEVMFEKQKLTNSGRSNGGCLDSP